MLLRAAQRLQALIENWSPAAADLGPALTYNRKLWTILAASAVDPENPLPPALKANVAQLAAVIFQRTIAVTAEPAPEKLALLVRINREVASGLRARPNMQVAAMAAA